MRTLALLPLLLLCSCGQTSDLPAGYECMTMQDGFYLRSNGVSIMTQKYATREEAKGQAWTWAGRVHHDDPNHIKLDAVLSVEFGTNQFFTNLFTTNLSERIPIREVVHRFVWISFNIYGQPFKGLVLDNVISDQLVPTNTFTLKAAQ